MECFYENEFRLSLLEKRDNIALCLLKNGHVAIRPSWTGGDGAVCPLLFLALRFWRERVARHLVRLGVDIDQFQFCDKLWPDRDAHNQKTNAVGLAILEDHHSMIILLYRLGIKISVVIPSTLPGIHSLNAIKLAVGSIRPSSFACFLRY